MLSQKYFLNVCFVLFVSLVDFTPFFNNDLSKIFKIRIPMTFKFFLLDFMPFPLLTAFFSFFFNVNLYVRSVTILAGDSCTKLMQQLVHLLANTTSNNNTTVIGGTILVTWFKKTQKQQLLQL